MVSSPQRREHNNFSVPQYQAAGQSQFGVALLPESLFGTDGIRGKAGELLSAPLALQIGYWTGQVLRRASAPGPVMIGQDPRNSSDMLAAAIAAGLTAVGLEVWHLGVCPTPGVAYLTSITNAIGGIMISASHNPPEDNGIKIFCSDGTKLPTALARRIEAGIRGSVQVDRAEAPTWGRYYARPELVENYAQSLRRSHSSISFSGMRIVLDPAWGAAVGLAPSIFEELGAQVICLHNQPDGDRINVNCGATHLEPLRSAVTKHQADLGWAFDGDADRAMAVDSRGRVINGDYLLYLWGKKLKEQQQLPDSLIIATVMANLGFERAWEQLGGKLIRTPVGDRFVQEQMQQTGAKLGGEQSGHLVCHHYGVSGDGIQTALHLTTLVRQQGTTLAELVDQSFQTYPQILRNVRVEANRRSHWQNCQPVQEAIAKAQAEMGGEGRVLVRASGTEPVIRVMVEAAEARVAQYWSEQLVTLIQQHLGS